ncbi:hypothetical protein DRO19_02570 [Candidatus Bathyarchaeota archaeon]|nr:MAG: hypothetical protein DRO19_02570 [Candidatus Bathyarchaeota archaeon]
MYERVKVPIFGCGGITNWKNAIEFMVAGASAIQVGTALAIKGIEDFNSILKGIKTYVKKRGLRSINEIVGLSHNL